tara:strand:+ start:403 stop:1596 length:1194 start_codon:yes stop_codon:yes gene_type:complete
MGGIAAMPEKPMPQVGGIMASSPELMQAAAMRRPVVLPSTTQPTPMPMPQGAASMLPPSRPIPNIAGIPQMGQPQPRPQPRPQPQPPQKPGVKKMFLGGMTDAITSPVSFVYNKMFELGQKALTSKDPEELGKPDATKKVKEAKETLKDPEKAAEEIINESLPKEMQTGNTGDDLRKVAQDLGIERVPAEAEVDQLNKAIFGAKLAGAIGGNYVNPQTGQELRPTAGKRIADAAVEGLTFARDTETRRAETEMELAKAKIAADAVDPVNPNAWYGTDEGEFFEKLLTTAMGTNNNNLPAALDDIAESYPNLVRKAKEVEAAGGSMPNVTSPSTSGKTPVTEGVPTVDVATGKITTIVDGQPVVIAEVDMSQVEEGMNLQDQNVLLELSKKGALKFYD